MSKTDRNTAVLVSALSVMIIIALTAGGIGGNGRRTITAYAETAPLQEQEGRKVQQEFLDSVKKRELTRRIVLEKAKKPRLAAGAMSAKEKAGHPDQSDRKEAVGLSLEEREKKSVPVTDNFSREDYEVLLKIVEAEAGICDSKGKILVANVVLNRVKSEEFPDTVKGVVYQPSQFSPVSNGTINTCQVTEQTVECVGRALKGEDYSRGALYFMNRGAARNGAVRWFDNRLDYLFSHGGHEFFK